MYYGHLENISLKANPECAEELARQHVKYCNSQIRHCCRQLRYYRRLRFKKQLDNLHPLLVLLFTVAVFSLFIVFSAL